MAVCCGDCRFFSALKEICRKNPPTVFPMADAEGKIGAVGMFPPVKADNWCGSFEPAPETEERTTS